MGNGVQLMLTIEGTIEDFDTKAFRDRLALILNIQPSRIPLELITVQAGSIIVKFPILEPPTTTTSATGGTNTTGGVDATNVLALLETLLVNGDLLDMGAVALQINGREGTITGSTGSTGSSMGSGGGGGASGIVSFKAPTLPVCSQALTTDDPCDECLARKGCGYCGGTKYTTKPKSKSSTGSSSKPSSSVRPTTTTTSTNSPPSCMIGGSIGPAIGTGTCPQGAWFYGTPGPSVH